MKDNIEDRLRYKGTQLVGLLPNFGTTIDNVCGTYVQFHNSKDKSQRVKLLRELRIAAKECQKHCMSVIEFLGGNVFEGATPSINTELTKRVRAKAGDQLYTAYQTLALLGKNLVGINTSMRAVQANTKTEEEKAYEVIQLLFQMHIVAADIAEISQITDPEPSKLILTN
jgi:hypothetical protein